jgi:hypothetical protein
MRKMRRRPVCRLRRRSRLRHRRSQQWQDGEPKSVWYGGVKMSKRDQFGITTFRCDRCGYLESYALG